jgi:hypothetical protein
MTPEKVNDHTQKDLNERMKIRMINKIKEACINTSISSNKIQKSYTNSNRPITNNETQSCKKKSPGSNDLLLNSTRPSRKN